MNERARFEAALDFPLDDFQRRALDALDDGASVLVAAPTGSGKTVVAEYAVARAVAAGGKAFYTTPLKALSNQKFADLRRVHGPERVGLLTGDTSVNGDAPVVVMTTEVLRNMIYNAAPALEGLRCVVLDEVHYLQDRYRGAVWEEVIVHLAPEVELVCLSATVSNAEEFADWIATVRGAVTPVIEERRPVALHHRYLVGERGSTALQLLPTFVGDGDDLRPNPEAARLDRRGGRGARSAPGRARSRLRPPDRADTIELLADEQLLPAIVFVFSRKGCDQAVDLARAAGVRLTTRDEAHQIRRIAEAHLQDLADEDLAVLGVDAWLDGLAAGLAAHHAGLVPPMKEAVEETFGLGLVKVVYATETLALGINMPARSVVIERLTKFTGERHEFLTPGEYTQLTGRAGRRGIDDVGYALVCWSPWVTFDQVAGLASRRSDALTSSFRPTYNMTVNLVRRYSATDAHHLVNLSFAQYRADRDVVALERQLERTREQLARQRERAGEPGDVDEYRALLARRDDARRGAGGASSIGAAIERLRSGDVVSVPARGGRVAVLAQEHRRGGRPRILALTSGKGLVRLGVDDFRSAPRAIGRIHLPEPYTPRNPNFRREAALRLRQAEIRDAEADAPRDRLAALEAELAAHPLGKDPARDARVRAAASAERLERDVARLERRAASRSESLARQFDRVLGLLESWGYVDGWALTEAGEILARLYTETDLLLAESLREGLLDDLTVPELAAVVSCFTYERRGADDEMVTEPVRWATRRIADRSRRIEALWRSLAAAEDDARLPETRPPDPGFTGYLYDWANGETLPAVLDDDELAGGDFVRHVKQCIDLLRQLSEVAPSRDTAATAGAAADRCFRGVVAAASAVA